MRVLFWLLLSCLIDFFGFEGPGLPLDEPVSIVGYERVNEAQVLNFAHDGVPA